MSFSSEWEQKYRAGHMSIWPWSDLVSYVMRYARPSGPDYRVLELGCGAGANIPFFKSLGVKYYAIEGSPSIVETLRNKFSELEANIVVGDFSEDIPFSVDFDLVVDRSSITHNTTRSIKKSLAMVYSKLKTEGKFIGIDWFSTQHSDYQNGVIDEDVYTRRDYTSGQFANIGRVHFSDITHLIEIFESFRLELLEHKIIKREIPEDNHIFASWNLVVKKVEK